MEEGNKFEKGDKKPDKEVIFCTPVSDRSLLWETFSHVMPVQWAGKVNERAKKKYVIILLFYFSKKHTHINCFSPSSASVAILLLERSIFLSSMHGLRGLEWKRKFSNCTK